MKTAVSLLALLLSAAPVMAREIPGLVSARLLPGWVEGDQRIAALEIQLEPGWKTYWRSPGPAGIPPQFDWAGSQNIGEVAFLWPRPEMIDSGGERVLGYHDRLVLPLMIEIEDADAPQHVQARVDFGICENICVPVSLALIAPPPEAGPDPVIEAALRDRPTLSDMEASCEAEPIADGLRLAVSAPGASGDLVVAFEDPEIWVSLPETTARDGMLRAEFEAVAPSGKPFSLDDHPGALLVLRDDAALVFPDACSNGRDWPPARPKG